MTDGPQQPHQPPGPGEEFRPADGYGYPPAHPGPAGTPEPDWTALAARAAQGDRRRRRYLVGGGVLAVLLVAGIVATAVVVSGNDGNDGKAAHAGPSASPSATGPVEPSATFSDVTPPPAPDPLTIVSDASRDTAPLTAAGLFPGSRLDWSGRDYTKAATDSTTVCGSAASGQLAAVLSRYGCRTMLRATYYRGDSEVTVGVAVFATPAGAAGAKKHALPYVLPLAGGPGAFCHATACQATANAIGRYAYFTIAGRSGNLAVSADDPRTRQSATDVANFAFNRIMQRGRDRATAPAGTG